MEFEPHVATIQQFQEFEREDTCISQSTPTKTRATKRAGHIELIRRLIGRLMTRMLIIRLFRASVDDNFFKRGVVSGLLA